jgi:hypothetical protein
MLLLLNIGNGKLEWFYVHNVNTKFRANLSVLSKVGKEDLLQRYKHTYKYGAVKS